MEVKQTIYLFKQLRKLLLPVLLLVIIGSNVNAQPPIKSFVVKNGSIFITLSKNMPAAELDVFVEQYSLQELDLKNFFKTNRPDSLVKLGWAINLNNAEMLVLSKSMTAFEKIMDPVEKILLAQKRFNNGYGYANKEPLYGYNKFTKKYPFAVKDSLGHVLFAE